MGTVHTLAVYFFSWCTTKSNVGLLEREEKERNFQPKHKDVHLDSTVGIVPDSELTTELWQYGMS